MNMAAVPFYAGSFNSIPFELVEWDGTNEVDVCDWLNQRAVDGTSSPDPWSITSVSGSTAVFTNADNAKVVNVPLGWWINAEGPWSVTLNNPAGKWKTSDIHGRPGDLDDLLP